MKIGNMSKIVMIGDSVTDSYRSKPDGEIDLGNGYVNMVQTLLTSCYPKVIVRVINKGIGGNTSTDVRNRWEEDVLDLKPNWITLLVGTNDVLRRFDSPQMPELAVNIDEYRDNLNYMVETSLTTLDLDGFILMTPYFVEPNMNDKMRQMVDEYAFVMKDIGKKFNLPVIDIQKVFDDALKVKSSWNIAFDRLHPTNAGHMMMARALLKELEFEFYHGE